MAAAVDCRPGRAVRRERQRDTPIAGRAGPTGETPGPVGRPPRAQIEAEAAERARRHARGQGDPPARTAAAKNDPRRPSEAAGPRRCRTRPAPKDKAQGPTSPTRPSRIMKNGDGAYIQAYTTPRPVVDDAHQNHHRRRPHHEPGRRTEPHHDASTSAPPNTGIHPRQAPGRRRVLLPRRNLQARRRPQDRARHRHLSRPPAAPAHDETGPRSPARTHPGRRDLTRGAWPAKPAHQNPAAPHTPRPPKPSSNPYSAQIMTCQNGRELLARAAEAGGPRRMAACRQPATTCSRSPGTPETAAPATARGLTARAQPAAQRTQPSQPDNPRETDFLRARTPPPSFRTPPERPITKARWLVQSRPTLPSYPPRRWVGCVCRLGHRCPFPVKSLYVSPSVSPPADAFRPAFGPAEAFSRISARPLAI